jgi:hypothetical protein
MYNEIEKLQTKSKKQLNYIAALCFFLMTFFYSASAKAQCAMCRAALESEGNQTKSQAVNDGIVYLMAIPYILAAIVGYVVYRMYIKKKTT